MLHGRSFFDEALEYKEAHIVRGMRAGRGYEVSAEHAVYEAAVRAAAAEDERVRWHLESHSEASVMQAQMSERFLCGPPGGAPQRVGERSKEETELDEVRKPPKLPLPELDPCGPLCTHGSVPQPSF
jgi:hypothetical protein